MPYMSVFSFSFSFGARIFLFVLLHFARMGFHFAGMVDKTKDRQNFACRRLRQKELSTCLSWFHCCCDVSLHAVPAPTLTPCALRFHRCVYRPCARAHCCTFCPLAARPAPQHHHPSVCLYIPLPFAPSRVIPLNFPTFVVGDSFNNLLPLWLICCAWAAVPSSLAHTCVVQTGMCFLLRLYRDFLVTDGWDRDGHSLSISWLASTMTRHAQAWHGCVACLGWPCRRLTTPHPHRR